MNFSFYNLQTRESNSCTVDDLSFDHNYEMRVLNDDCSFEFKLALLAFSSNLFEAGLSVLISLFQPISALSSLSLASIFTSAAIRVQINRAVILYQLCFLSILAACLHLFLSMLSFQSAIFFHPNWPIYSTHAGLHTKAVQSCEEWMCCAACLYGTNVWIRYS